MRKITRYFRNAAGVCWIGALLLCVVMTGCGKDKGKESTSATSGSTTGSEATQQTSAVHTTEPTVQTSEPPAQTTQSTQNMEQTQNPTTEPTTQPATKVLLSEDETFAKLIAEIDINQYSISLAGEYQYEDRSCFAYKINEADILIAEILVDRGSGNLYYRNSDGIISDFNKFPPDQGQPVPTPSDGKITEEKALELLKGITKEALGLPADLEEYVILFDEWTTLVNGTECYGVNAFADLGSRKQLMGVYYVALDGSAVYTIDSESGEFLLLK